MSPPQDPDSCHLKGAASSVPTVEHRIDSPSVGRVDPGIDGGARHYGHTDTAAHQRYIGRAPAVPQRWRIDAPTVDQHEKDADGEWMRAEDVLPLLDRLQRRDAALRELEALRQQLTAATTELERWRAVFGTLEKAQRNLDAIAKSVAVIDRETARIMHGRGEPGGQ